MYREDWIPDRAGKSYLQRSDITLGIQSTATDPIMHLKASLSACFARQLFASMV